jgi:hypothetical protein
MRLLSQADGMDPERLENAQIFANWLLEIGNGYENSNDVDLPKGTKLTTFNVTLDVDIFLDRNLPSSFIRTNSKADYENLSEPQFITRSK